MGLTYTTIAFSQDGTLDLSLNGTGIAVYQPGTFHDVANAVGVQSDGKIIIGGVTSNDGNYNFDMAIGRLNVDGTLDDSFGNFGWFTFDYAGESDYIYDLIVLPNDEIIACGADSITVDNTDIAVIKLDANGSPMPSFGGGDGMVIHAIDTGQDYARDMIVQNDGSIILGGVTIIPDTYTGSTLLMKLLPNGAPDNTFGSNGRVITTLGENTSEFNSIAEDDLGNIYGVGFSEANFNQFLLVESFSSSGVLNSSFANAGTYNATSPSTAYCVAWTNGHLVVGGNNNAGSISQIYLLALNPQGELDPSFGSQGESFLSLSQLENCFDLAIDSDGQIVVAGTSGPVDFFTRDILCARFDTNGIIDDTFGTNGTFVQSVGDAFDDANALVIQDDGKIVLAGFTASSNNDMAVIRLGHTSGNGMENQEIQLLSIYPNPSAGLMTNAPSRFGKCSMTIYDNSGRTVLTSAINTSTYTLDCSRLQAGEYYVVLTQDAIILEEAKIIVR